VFVPSAERGPDADDRHPDDLGDLDGGVRGVGSEQQPDRVPAGLLDTIAAGAVRGPNSVRRAVANHRQTTHRIHSHEWALRLWEETDAIPYSPVWPAWKFTNAEGKRIIWPEYSNPKKP
jgi:hypothetical protein